MVFAERLVGAALKPGSSLALLAVYGSFAFLGVIIAIGCTIYVFRGKKGASFRIALGGYVHSVGAMLFFVATLLCLLDDNLRSRSILTAVAMAVCIFQARKNFKIRARKRNKRLSLSSSLSADTAAL